MKQNKINILFDQSKGIYTSFRDKKVTMEIQENHIDELLDEKIKPLIKEATTKLLGISVDALTDDITAKLTRGPVFDFSVDTTLKFKEAKRQFKKAYIKKMLQLHFGNISEAARYAGIDRRSIHRLISSFHINIEKIKKELLWPYDLKRAAVSHAIEDVLDKYKDVFHPGKLEKMYKNVSVLSNDLLKKLPERHMALKEAEEEFERAYLKKALEENQQHIVQTAKRIGLRYETLHRKMKSLGIE